MNNEYDFLKKQRYEYYKGTTEIMDNEVDEFVEDVVDVLNQKSYNINELLKINQLQAERIEELKEQLANSIRPKFKIKQTVYRIYQDKIENGMISEIRVDEIGITYHITMYKSKYCETYCYVNENDLFSTKAEAEAKLKELKGENK